MSRSRRIRIAKGCGHILGLANVILLVLGASTTLTLSLAVVLAPFTLAVALKFTTFLACNMTSLAVGDSRERAELLICAIGAVQPPTAGENYQEAMVAEIRAARSHQIRTIASNLMVTAPRTIIGSWIRVPGPLRKWAAKR